MYIDLHVHTTASDGTFSPEAIVREAEKIGLTAVAITDHDSVNGIQPALRAAADCRVLVVPGIEINTDYKEHELHVLGYYLNYQQPVLKQQLVELAARRLRRVSIMVAKLQQLGYDLTLEDVQLQSAGGSIGRPHIARALMHKGYISAPWQAFHNLIGRGCPAYEPRCSLSAAEAVRLISQAGGVPVWAHPGHTKDDNVLPELLAAGLQGIEVYYPDHTRQQIKHYRRLAEEHNLLMTGGTDFHGDITKNQYWLGALEVADEILENLRQRKQQLEQGTREHE